MKVGVEHSLRIKEKSKEMSIPFSDAVELILTEDFLLRIYRSEFAECLLLAREYRGMQGMDAKKDRRLDLYYVESDKNIPINRLVPGQKLSGILQEEMFRAWEGKGDAEIAWNHELKSQVEGSYYEWQLTGSISDMQVPITMRIRKLDKKSIRSRKQELNPIMESDKAVLLWVYAFENKMAEHLYEIIDRLELISDMEAFAAVNEILQSESVSGRHILEELQALTESRPKIRREQRIIQLRGYRDYAYMSKRWQQYVKRNPGKYQGLEDSWEVVIDRLTGFFDPVWTALCRNEIFFDDWMPELGRFLG